MLEYDKKFYLIKNGIMKPFGHKLNETALAAWKKSGWKIPTQDQAEAWAKSKLVSEKPSVNETKEKEEEEVPDQKEKEKEKADLETARAKAKREAEKAAQTAQGNR